MTALECKLGKLEKPDYDDEYTPPAYVVGYQLSHIYMAWKALSCLESALSLVEELRHRDSLRIVDFGAGASAGRIGAALMAADAIEDDRSIDSIYYDEIDTSAPMQEMGELVWQAFTNGVRHRFANTALARVVEAMNCSQHMDWRKVAKRDCETWLTAFHVTYQDNNSLKGKINRLAQHINPILGVFSCHEGNLGRMGGVFPFSPVYRWNSGFYPHHLGKTNGDVRCETNSTINRAIGFGFREENQWWPPFLQVKKCAILFGAKNAQAFGEERIRELKIKIQNAHTIDDSQILDNQVASQIPDSQVALGRKVVIRENGNDREETYTIVGAKETEPSKGRISNVSPIGKAVMGRTPGDVVRVEAPGGEFEYEIVRVEC